MSYLGEIRNGVVVLQDLHALKEGTVVRVEPVAVPNTRVAPGTREAMLSCDARWAGEPAELDRLLAEVQRARDADLTPAGNGE